MHHTGPIRKNRRPCACCGEHRRFGYLARGRWRGHTALTVCWRCFRETGDALRSERYREIAAAINNNWPQAA